jgi:hypothetical protein
MVRGTGRHGSHDRAGGAWAGVTQSNHDHRTADKRIYKLSLSDSLKNSSGAHETFSKCESPFRVGTSAARTVVMEIG